MTPFAAKLVSIKPCLYHDIFFAKGMKVSQKNKQSKTLSVLSVRIGWSMLHLLVTGDVGASWLAARAVRSDSPLPTTEGLQATLPVSSTSSWDRPVHSAAIFPATISSRFRLDLKKRPTTNEIRC